MEIVLYYIMECKDLVISFLIFMFVIAVICYFAIRNFDQTKRHKIIIYGLFSKMNTIDCLKISIVFIKTFIVFYSMLSLENTIIVVSIFMILILTVLYMILAPRRLFYELITMLFLTSIIYFIYTLDSYTNIIENTTQLLLIKISLIILLFLLSGYLFFREIYIIPEDRERLNKKREEKIKRKEESRTSTRLAE